MSSAWVPVAIMLAIVLVAAGVYVVWKVRKRDDPRKLLNDAKTEAADIKAAADVELAAELEAVNADKAELEAIEAIDDEDARLAALAKYGNRRRGSQ